MCINLNLCLLDILIYALIASNKLKTPNTLLSMNGLGPSIDLSTCVSAAKLKIPIGLYFSNNFFIASLLLMSVLKNLYFFLFTPFRLK